MQYLLVNVFDERADWIVLNGNPDHNARIGVTERGCISDPDGNWINIVSGVFDLSRKYGAEVEIEAPLHLREHFELAADENRWRILDLKARHFPYIEILHTMVKHNA